MSDTQKQSPKDVVEVSDRLVSIGESVARKFPELPKDVAMELGKTAPEAGHDDWYKSAEGKYMPHPIRKHAVNITLEDGQQTTLEGRSAFMPFSMVLEIRQNLVEGAQISKKAFVHRLSKELSRDISQFDYIMQMDPTQFNNWMYSIAGQNIDDNKGWAFSAAELMTTEDMLNADRQELERDLINLYIGIKYLQKPSSRATTSDTYRFWFGRSELLKQSMVLSHGNWRKRLSEKDPNKEVDPIIPSEAVASFKTILSTSRNIITIENIQMFVDDLRERVHLNPINPTNEETFNLMLDLAKVIEDKLDTDKKLNEDDIKELSKVRDSLISQLTYDANVAIPIAIAKALKVNIDFDNLVENI